MDPRMGDCDVFRLSLCPTSVRPAWKVQLDSEAKGKSFCLSY